MTRICHYKRQRVIDLLREGLSQRDIANQLNISQFSVRDIGKRHKEGRGVSDRPKTGRPHKIGNIIKASSKIHC